MRRIEEPAARQLLGLAGLCVCLLLSGCGGSTGFGSSGPFDAAVADGRVVLDLTSPRTPAELGLAPGDQYAGGSARDRRLMDVELHLPGGTLYSLRADLVAVDASAYSALVRVLVAVPADDAVEMNRLLERDVAYLGIDPEDVAQYRQWLHRRSSGSGEFDPVTKLFTGRSAGGIDVEVEARMTPDDPGGEDGHINYSFSWSSPGGAPAVTPTRPLRLRLSPPPTPAPTPPPSAGR